MAGAASSACSRPWTDTSGGDTTGGDTGGAVNCLLEGFVNPDAAIAPIGRGRQVADHVRLEVAGRGLHRRPLGSIDRSKLNVVASALFGDGCAAAVVAGEGDGLAILVSCVGRKLVMGDRVEEEIEAVTARLGQQARATGFYSYGEISPHGGAGVCQLHNQTMTVTAITEAA